MADASSSELGASFSGSFLADKTDNEGELNLQEDSDDDANDYSNALHNYFSDNDDLEESFLGFSSSDDSDVAEILEDDKFSYEDFSSDDDRPVQGAPAPTVTKDKAGPTDFDMNHWKKGDINLDPLPAFTGSPGINIDIPENATELDFFKLFITDDIVDSITLETNMYAFDYLLKYKDTLKPKSNFKRWPEAGITEEKIMTFIALTFYMGIVKKDLLRSYWSIDSVLSTPFPRTVMSRSEFFNIISFLHCCNAAEYPSKGEPGYNPQKKLGKSITIIKEKFQSVWTPRKQLSIDEGTIPFKGNIHFKVYNPNKSDKYGMKTYKLCDSSNGYCANFDLYVGKTDDQPPDSKYGKTYDIVMNLLGQYKKKGYIVYMDNFYSSPYLFYNLLVEEDTPAWGTVRPRKGLPKEIVSAKFKQRGEHKIMSYEKQMVAIRILDRKHVTLLSTAHNCKIIDIGKKNWKTKEPVMRHTIIHYYNQYMGGVDSNDQLLKYSSFSRQTVKWWKKVFFRLLNLSMVNAYIIYREWLKANNVKKTKTQTAFRVAVIK